MDWSDDDPLHSALGMGEAVLAEQLRATRCEGLLWEFASAILVGYAGRILHGLILDGRINAKMRQLRLRGAAAFLTWPELRHLGECLADREDLVAESLSNGMTRFRDEALLGGVWRPDGGASLPTYYVNTTTVCLPTAIRRWRVGRRHHDRMIAGDLAELESLGLLPAPREGDDEAVDAAVDRLVAAMPPRLARVVRYWREHPDLDNLSQAADGAHEPRSTVHRQWQQFRDTHEEDPS